MLVTSPDGESELKILVNDLSIAGQFPDVPTFFRAISYIMKMRDIAHQFGRELYCHRNIAHTQVTQHLKMQQAIQHFDRNEQRAIMQWLTGHGPFWEDEQTHSGGDWLEYNGEIVTDTAVGEAAFCCFHEVDCHLVSLTPSSWEFSPIVVNLVLDAEVKHNIDVINHWEVDKLKAVLQAAPAPIISWEQLAADCRTRCPHLTFSTDSFEPLQGCPFKAGAAERVRILLDKLEELKCCVDEQGRRTLEGQQILSNHFSGGKAWFSDSSESEKSEFKKDLTFPHPADPDKELFCTWHGKVKTPQYRIHFSDPFRTDGPLYIVHIGPKRTKR